MVIGHSDLLLGATSPDQPQHTPIKKIRGLPNGGLRIFMDSNAIRISAIDIPKGEKIEIRVICLKSKPEA